MLASITPLGERGRHRSYALTMTAFVMAATAAGAGLGAVLGGLGSLVAGGLAPSARLVLLAVAAAVALVLDLRPGPAPGPHRQVDERWLDRYRGWVYGVGYGAQLGFGLATVVSSAATYVALLAALLSAGVGSGAVVLGVYGAVRGLTPLLAVGVRRPDQLMTWHARFLAGRRPFALAGRIGLLAVTAVAVMGAAA